MRNEWQRPVSFADSEITGGFWKQRQEITRKVTIGAVYDRFKETGRFDALKFDWMEGMPNKPHIFWDSDTAKWIEGAAYFLQKKRDAELEAKVDELVGRMKAAQRPDGYLNSYFQTVEPDAVFTGRMRHELYCAGHLMEGAIAYAQATGKTDMLEVVCRYADYIDKVFRIEHSASFDTPGHEEIELALIKLSRYTGNEKYLKLAEYFVNTRGTSPRDEYDPSNPVHSVPVYSQSHLPVREQETAEGHCVRALYLYCAMVDLAAETGDEKLLEASKKLFDNIYEKRMYLTGGVGSTHLWEAFTYDYDLPEYEAYNETCASIALAMFCRRLWLAEADGRYADCAEQALYNTVLSGVSLDGERFFYENPLSVDPKRNRFYNTRPVPMRKHLPILERVKVFGCSCCPPNLLRMIGSVADLMYSTSDDTIYAHCYMEADSEIRLGDQIVKLSQKTEYPYDGRVSLTVGTSGSFTLAVRIPGWCGKTVITVNGVEVCAVNGDGKCAADGGDVRAADGVDACVGGDAETCAVNGTAESAADGAAVRRGYVYIRHDWKEGDRLVLDMDMPVRLVWANPMVTEANGRVAITRGPLVYCAEGSDNQDRPLKSIRVNTESAAEVSYEEIGGLRMPVIRMEAVCPAGSERLNAMRLYAMRPYALEPCSLKLVPYFAWANRGVTEMTTWFLTA